MRVALLILIAACATPTKATVVGPQLVHGAHRLAIEGVEVAFEVRGTGPIVCLAHPDGPGMDAGYLRIPALEHRFTMVYVDPVGTGASGKLAAGVEYSMARDVATLEGVRMKLGIDKVCLVGHSYGGMVAQLYAVKHAAHVMGMFLYSTTPTTVDVWKDNAESNVEWFKSQPWFADANAASTSAGRATTQDELDAALLRQWPLFFADWSGHRAAYEPLVRSIKMSLEVSRRPNEEPFDVRSRLGVVHTTPTVIVAGDKDIFCGPKPGMWLSQAIAGSKLIVIEGAGHFAHIEQPAAFDDAVGVFAATM